MLDEHRPRRARERSSASRSRPSPAEGGLFGFATDDYWLGVGRPELLLQANLDRLAGRFDADMEHPCSGGRGVDPAATVADGADGRRAASSGPA